MKFKTKKNPGTSTDLVPVLISTGTKSVLISIISTGN